MMVAPLLVPAAADSAGVQPLHSVTRIVSRCAASPLHTVTHIEQMRCKPAEYVSHLVGHEGKGSLLAALKVCVDAALRRVDSRP